VLFLLVLEPVIDLHEVLLAFCSRLFEQFFVLDHMHRKVVLFGRFELTVLSDI